MAGLLLAPLACGGSDAPAAPPTSGIAFSTHTPNMAAGAPYLVLSATGTNTSITSVEFQVDSSTWLPATTSSLPAQATSLELDLPGLPIGDHDVHLRASGTNDVTAEDTLRYRFTATDALTSLQQLGVVASNATPELNVTRAQLAMYFVRLFGQDGNAQLLAGSSPYTDVPGSYWASGYIAMLKSIAQQQGFEIGYSDGSYHPDQNATVGEVVGFLDRLLGIPPMADLAYPDKYVWPLENNGLIPPDQSAQGLIANANGPATLGLTAELQYQAWVRYAPAGGQTPAQRYIDSSWRLW